MSPSLNSKLRSLILADQSMGLNMSPKVERQSAADFFAPEPESATSITNNVIETPRVAHASFVAPTVAFTGGAATQDAKGIACSSTMQWGFTRDLPTSMQERREALLEIQSRHDATCALCQKNKSNIEFSETWTHDPQKMSHPTYCKKMPKNKP